MYERFIRCFICCCGPLAPSSGEHTMATCGRCIDSNAGPGHLYINLLGVGGPAGMIDLER